VPPARDQVEDLYRRILAQGLDLTGGGLSGLFLELYEACLAANIGYTEAELTTQITAKSYFAFERPNGKISRAVNRSLYEPSPETWTTLVEALRDQDFAPLTLAEMTKAVYSLAMSFCVHIDLTRTGKPRNCRLRLSEHEKV
jgi:hypothetical protein